MDEFSKTNLAHWNELVGVHVGAGSDCDVEGFKRGRITVKAVERRELGDVAGKSLLHLQCHFGMDTLSWGRLGARVKGVDFCSNIYDLPEALSGEFDIVYTAYGALTWLPDLPCWARVAAHFLRPGGTFYLAEFYPTGWIFDDAPGTTELRVRYPYFPSEAPLMYEEEGSYADRTANVANRRTYNYPFTIGDVVTSLIDARSVSTICTSSPVAASRRFRSSNAGLTGSGTCQRPWATFRSSSQSRRPSRSATHTKSDRDGHSVVRLG